MSIWDAIEGTQEPTLSEHHWGKAMVLWMLDELTSGEAVDALELMWGDTLTAGDQTNLTEMRAVYDGENNLGKVRYIAKIEAAAALLAEGAITQTKARTIVGI